MYDAIGVPHNVLTAEWLLHINLAKACTFILLDSKNIRPPSTPPVQVRMKARMAEVKEALRRAYMHGDGKNMCSLWHKVLFDTKN
jgi:hypothetical protein